MVWYVLHITYVTRLVSFKDSQAFKGSFHRNRRIGLLKSIFEKDFGFKNIQLSSGVSNGRLVSGLGLTRTKIVHFRKRSPFEYGNRFSPTELYIFANVYSQNKGKVQRLAKRMEDRRARLYRKYPLLKDFFVYPEIRQAGSYDLNRWDSEAFAMYRRKKNKGESIVSSLV
ncbi:MAG: hypothetical protein ABH829_02225 [archaeon]